MQYHPGPVREAVLAIVHSRNGNQLMDGQRFWVVSLTPPASDWSTTGQEYHPSVLLVFVDPDTGKARMSSQYGG